MVSNVSGCGGAMNILSSNLLIVHSDYISAVSTYISFLILIRALQQIIATISSSISTTVLLGLGPGRPTISGLTVRMVAMDPWKLFRGLVISTLILAVHA